MKNLAEMHEETKATRQRGAETPSHMAALVYLRGLERELDRIRGLLSEAWVNLENTRDFRKCSRHMDHAQQRMHKVIRRLKKAE